MPNYADSGDYTWYTPDTVFDHIAANPPYQLDNERLSELVSGGGALYDVPPVVAKDVTNTVFVPVGTLRNDGMIAESMDQHATPRDAVRSNGGSVTVHDVRYDMRTCNDRHTEEMGKLWAALVHLQRRVEELEAFNTPGK